MKLNYKRTILVGFAFFLISAFWQAYDAIVPLILTNHYGLPQAISGVVMSIDNILAVFMLPIFGALSDKVMTRFGKRTPFIVIGTVAAGTPILAEENIDSYFPVPADIVPNGEPSFVLKVKGDSMINVGIFNGDQIFVQQCNTAKNGDTVVAMNDNNEVTVKTFYKEDGYFRLQPENDTMEPIILKECTILGKAVGLYRKL